MASGFKAGKVPNSMRPKGARNKISGAEREQRRLEATERQAVRDAMTPQAQLARLDTLLGKDQGAKKERTRLAMKILRAKDAPPAVVGTNAVVKLDGQTIDVKFAPLDTAKLSKRERRAAKEKAAK